MQMGYIRVSSKDQNEERQVKKMLDLDIEERMIFIDKQSGKDFNRPSYQTMKRFVREGDLIYIDALDRLGRDYDGIIREWKEITRDLNADIVCLDKQDIFDSRKFKTMGDMGKLMEDQFLSLLSFVAEQERKKIRQRQAEGIAVAKAKGKRLGRPQLNLDTISEEQKKLLKSNYKRWKAQEITGVQFMKILDLKKNTFYKVLKEFENAQSKILEVS
jgi:DNA invertase Pin-like site-specific DNA recombinase